MKKYFYKRHTDEMDELRRMKTSNRGRELKKLVSKLNMIFHHEVNIVGKMRNEHREEGYGGTYEFHLQCI